MTEKKLKKKTVVTSKQEGLTQSEVVEDTQTKIDLHTKYSAIVTVDPTPLAMQTKVDKVVENVGKREVVRMEEQNLTGEINSGIDEIKSIIVDKWCKQVQNAIGDNADNAKLLGYGVKGIYDGHAEPEYNITNSHASITDVNIDSHLAQTLTIKNNKTGLAGLLDDSVGIDVYEYFGKDQPTSVSQMTYLGRATRGKYTIHFTEDQIGMMVWYYVVYVPRKTGVIPEIGKMESSVVV